MLVGVNDDICYNCGRRNPGLWGFAPALRALGNDLGFVPLVMGACILLYAATILMTGLQNTGFLLGVSNVAAAKFGASGPATAYDMGRWWTVLSAGWLHGNILHIFFNMMSLRQLLPGVADIFGPARTVIIYVAGSAAGFIVSTMASIFYLPGSSPSITLGASAGISALVGAIWHYGRSSGNSLARSYATTTVIYMIIIGLMLPFIDNYAHAGGVAGGYLLSMVMDPMKRERVDHMVLALVLLALSLASVGFSLLIPLRF